MSWRVLTVTKLTLVATISLANERICFVENAETYSSLQKCGILPEKNPIVEQLHGHTGPRQEHRPGPIFPIVAGPIPMQCKHMINVCGF